MNQDRSSSAVPSAIEQAIADYKDAEERRLRLKGPKLADLPQHEMPEAVLVHYNVEWGGLPPGVDELFPGTAQLKGPTRSQLKQLANLEQVMKLTPKSKWPLGRPAGE